MLASARAIVNTVVFILFSPAGLFYLPLTISSCGRRPENSIDSVSYKS
jgi:hypothetical protein